MQDNKRINNEELIDAGWAQMQTILDKELPVKNNKRRLLLWFLLGIFLISSGIILFNNLGNNKTSSNAIVAEIESIDNQKNNPSTINESLEEDETINKTNTDPSTNTTINNEDWNDEKEVEIQEESKILKSLNNESGSKIVVIENTINEVNGKIITNQNDIAIFEETSSSGDQSIEPVVDSEIVGEIFTDIHPEEPSLKDQEIVSGSVKDLKESPDTPFINRAEDDLNALGSLGSLVLEPLYFENLPFVYSDQSVQKKFIDRADKKLSFGLFAGLISTNKILSNGYQFGVDSDINFNEKFGLNTSLGFTRIINKESESLGIDAAEVVENPETMDEMTIVISSSIAYDILNTRNYLDFSIKPRYRIDHRLSVAAGPSIGYLLRAKNETNSRGTLNLNSSFLEEEKLINKIDLALNMEVRFDISKRLGFSLLYNHGLKSLWKQSKSLDPSSFNPSIPSGELIYKNTGSNFNRFLSLRGHFTF